MLIYAVNNGNMDLIRCILADKQGVLLVNVADDGGRSPLIEAARAGQTDVAAALIAAGADVNGKDKRNNTALHMACLFERTEVVQLLVKHKADVNYKNCNGDAALLYSAEKASLPGIVALLACSDIGMCAHGYLIVQMLIFVMRKARQHFTSRLHPAMPHVYV